MTRQDMVSDRESLMGNPEVQAIVQRMVDQGIYLITPKVDTSGITYPALSGVFGDKSEIEIDEFLTKLTSAGILRSKLLDKVIVCPTCGSPSVYSKYNCPRCSSFDIGKASIIEHIRCGYIGSKEKFLKDGILICPKCKNSVSEVDYRKIGTSFECNSCGSRFEAPRMSHKCNSCDDVFTYKEARYEPIYEFELSEETKRSVARGTLPLASIVSTLKQSGFDVGQKRDLVGKSGATHNFDIVAKKDSVLVVANFTFEPKEEDIIGLFAKKYDVDPTFTLLIALTPPSKEEEAVSRAYGVMIVSSAGSLSIGEQIIELVEAHLKAVEVPAGAETQPEPMIPIPQQSIPAELPKQESEKPEEEKRERTEEKAPEAIEAPKASARDQEKFETESPRENLESEAASQKAEHNEELTKEHHADEMKQEFPEEKKIPEPEPKEEEKTVEPESSKVNKEQKSRRKEFTFEVDEEEEFEQYDF